MQHCNPTSRRANKPTRTADRSHITRLAIVLRGPLDVAYGSGTAVAIRRLRRALAGANVNTAVFGPARQRWMPGPGDGRFLRIRAAPAGLAEYQAVMGVDGAGRDLAGQAGTPFIMLVKALYAGALPHEPRWRRPFLLRSLAIERSGARRADLVITPSRFAADAVVGEYEAPADCVRIVPEPFDADEWLAALPVRPRRGRRVLCVAHLYPRKRVTDLLEAWPVVRATVPDARLDVVGAGPELRVLERRGRNLSGCFFHGFVRPDAMPEFYARADCFCLPSAQETFGYAVVEAMASGLPVAVADAGAPPELIADAVGVTVPVADPAALARAVLHCLEPSVCSAAAHINPGRTRAFAPALVARQILDAVASAERMAQRRAGGSAARDAEPMDAV